MDKVIMNLRVSEMPELDMATGSDEMQWKLIKELNANNKKLILNFINKLWNSKSVPVDALK